MSFIKNSRAKELIDNVGKLEISSPHSDFEENDFILFRSYVMARREQLGFFKKIQSKFVTLPEYVEMYYYAVSQYNLRAHEKLFKLIIFLA